MLKSSSQRFSSTSSSFSQSHFRFLTFFSRSFSVAHHNIQSYLQLQPPYNGTHNELIEFFDYILGRCITTQQCKQVHAKVVLTGGHWSGFLAARLVSVYSRLGLVKDSRKVFDNCPVETSSSNMLLWNSIVRANVSNGLFIEALELYDKMLKFGVWADGFTFPLVIRACAFIGDLFLCKRIHCRVLLMGFNNHLHVVNELLGMYGKLGQMKNASHMFDGMAIRSYVSWNYMISGYAFNRDYDGAIKMFRRMELEGFEPNSITWTSLLSSHARCGKHEETIELFGLMRSKGLGATAETLAVVLSVCADLAAVNTGKMIHGYVIKGGFEDYLFAKNALICLYGKCGDVEHAQKSFLEMKTKNIVSRNALISSYAESGLCDEAFEIFIQLEKSNGYPLVRPNIISWSAVIGGFAAKGRGEESLELFRRMQLTTVRANSVTVCSILSVCAELAALNLGREIHGNVIRAMMDDNILVGNGLINMYTKCGNFKEGQLIFENLDTKDLISWNSMITGYGIQGIGQKALSIFDQMIKSGFKPDNVTFVSILSACSHAGLINEGRSLFNQMSGVYGIEPQMEHYSCMVDLLGRAGLLQEASNIIKNMPMKPNACVWSALLNSCRMYKNISITEETADHIFHQINLESTGSYMLLSNIYAASGKWEESAKVRISAKTKGLKKIPGQSWIEVKKKVYMFSAGNAGQVNSKLVYGLLRDLAFHMESEGYIPNGSINIQNLVGVEMNVIVEVQ
ncbi:putative pentatricopeptide repeat-containing protein At1g17630 [Humulus lupulus]|uniref:putative pentatricopeptide repeat-containing protein At1g17630 n=1 Tax=Humulus lupulus TaxID=3486 RepID=UPI002B40F910|nr:putative pentatricopeptide repeat-containing protein At1g17630 [Humulus lupulus]